MSRPLNYEQWKQNVHTVIKNDPLWNFLAYQKALFAYDLMWEDCEYLLHDERGKAIARQLARSVGSISANIEEGYGRGYGKDYAYRLKIAIGEARESRGWYWKGRRLLSEELLNHRLMLIDEIIALIAPNISKQSQFKKK
ncbi:four helix bundle protein [Candidatus Leptofilum sp.]|uniref:four helix bundle protein n=1 Tax=Candidatus Leptofilum sp. TaxID=3241576 RepID=UPI003B5BAD69